MFIKTDSGAFKIRFKGFSFISQSKVRFTINADDAGLVTLRKKIEIRVFLSFWSKLHTKKALRSTDNGKESIIVFVL